MPRFFARRLVVVLFTGLWVPCVARGSVAAIPLTMGCSAVDVLAELEAVGGQAGADVGQAGAEGGQAGPGEVNSAGNPSVHACRPRAECCKVCDAGKACGDSCISESYACHKGVGCACNIEELCPGS